MRNLSTLLLVALFATGMTAQKAAKSTADSPYKIGDKVASFSLPNIDDTAFDLAAQKDVKGFIVVFTCNHCPYAIKYEDRLIELHNKYAPLGYPVVAINSNDASQYPDDSFDNMKIRAKEKAFPFVYLYDETQAIAKKFGAKKTPHVFILEKKKKKMNLRYIGAIDDNVDEASAVKTKYAEAALGALLSGAKIAMTETKAIGCGIKWKK